MAKAPAAEAVLHGRVAEALVPMSALVYFAVLPLATLFRVDTAVAIARWAGRSMRRVSRAVDRALMGPGAVIRRGTSALAGQRFPLSPGGRGATEYQVTATLAAAMNVAIERVCAVKIMGVRPAFPSCLRKCVALVAGLECLGIRSTLLFGVTDICGSTAVNPCGPKGFEAHCRVLTGGMIVSEGPVPFPHLDEGPFRVMKRL